jgi:uncharacterized lipoprotein YmbA
MKRIVVLSILLGLTACSSQPPQTSHFLLRSDVQQQTRELASSTEFMFGAVTVADYINNPGLVVATGDGEVREARNHRWAEPLATSIKAFLAMEVSAQRGEDIPAQGGAETATRIDVAIDQLHGNTDGEAVLMAYWQLRSTKGDKRVFQFAETEALLTDGYPALAAAEKRLLQRLALQIAASLGTGAG